MHAEVFRGQLTYIDTDDGQIQLTDRADNKVTTLDFDADTHLSSLHGWGSLVGDDVEVVVIDGKTKDVYSLPIEE